MNSSHAHGQREKRKIERRIVKYLLRLSALERQADDAESIARLKRKVKKLERQLVNEGGHSSESSAGESEAMYQQELLDAKIALLKDKRYLQEERDAYAFQGLQPPQYLVPDFTVLPNTSYGNTPRDPPVSTSIAQLQREIAFVSRRIQDAQGRGFSGEGTQEVYKNTVYN